MAVSWGPQLLCLAPGPTFWTLLCAWANLSAEMSFSDPGLYLGVQKIPTVTLTFSSFNQELGNTLK